MDIRRTAFSALCIIVALSVGQSALAQGLDTSIDVNTYWDYDASAPDNQQRIDVEGVGVPTWGSFTWGDGTLWGANISGSFVTRTVSGTSLGWARAITIEFSTNSATHGVAWSISGIVGKVRFRQFTT